METHPAKSADDSSVVRPDPRRDDKPVFIYLLGASATGKTTLLTALVNALGAVPFTGAARSVIARWPAPTAAMLEGGRGGQDYADFQLAVLKAQADLDERATDVWWGAPASPGKSVVLDRGLDHLAYSCHFIDRFGPLYLQKAAETQARFAVRLGDFRPVLAVYIPPHPLLLQKARESRPSELQPFLTDACVGGVDAAIKALLLPYAGRDRFCSLAGVALEDRLETVLAAVRKVRANSAV